MSLTATTRLALVAAVLLASSRAEAHHVVSDTGIAGAEPRSVVELEFSAATFDREGQGGAWQTVTAGIELAFARRWSVGARIPLARIGWDDGHGAAGLGDVEIAGKVNLYASAHGGFIVSAGLGLELPTGDENERLGGGHVEVTPFTIASTAHELAPGRTLVLVGLVTGRLSVGGHEPEPAPMPRVIAHDTGAHGSVIGPHSDRELVARVLFAYVHDDRSYAVAGVEAVVVLGGEETGPWVGRLELGHNLGRWRLAAGFDATFAGDPRHDLLGRLALARRF